MGPISSWQSWRECGEILNFMYLCSNTEHELPLNAEHCACVSLDVLKVHKQEFNCSFSAEGIYFPIRWCRWKQKSNIENEFKLQFKVKKIISDFLHHLYFIILFCERHMNWYKPLRYFLKYVFSLNCSSLVLRFDIYTHFHHVFSEKPTLTGNSTGSAVPIQPESCCIHMPVCVYKLPNCPWFEVIIRRKRFMHSQ